MYEITVWFIMNGRVNVDKFTTDDGYTTDMDEYNGRSTVKLENGKDTYGREILGVQYAQAEKITVRKLPDE